MGLLQRHASDSGPDTEGSGNNDVNEAVFDFTGYSLCMHRVSARLRFAGELHSAMDIIVKILSYHSYLVALEGPV